ncbi:ankyrin repeat and LEM domain-containing protein 2 homolog isoform X2 [Drosophila kikkawai]|uniref:Ankyrin repeat and LEM domain-containing protein 2 homolog isoform X2 n=1 Tax=Drosophila kikkawai TaxID=30033 RepID=A0A6P4JH46_DROKI|nr:ankyrin repeat and LEM domain-containing protein 2 homolog isoform X2 [Drosophila kikkawai]
MSYFAVYVPPSKAVFEGKPEQCAGSIAAVRIQSLDASKSGPGPGSGLGPAAVPAEDSDYPPDSPLWLIFTEKMHALNVLRQFKDGRLREFPNQEQAKSYVQFGFESIESPKRFFKTKAPSSKSISIGYKSSPNSADNSYSSDSAIGSSSGFASMDGSLHISSSPTSSPGGSCPNGIISNGRQHHHQHHHQQELSGSGSGGGGGERTQFWPPNKQELQEFRRQIEFGNLERVKRIVWENPRFLISSGDKPTCLTDSCRYNALHICAQENQAKIAELLLKTISDPEFSQLYAGKKGTNPTFFFTLNSSLLDYYLNMPDSVRGDTPLHLAAKYGHANVAEVLLAYPQCNASLENIDGLQPNDLICQRSTAEASRKLNVLLSDPHYVPVLRSMANELPPEVGKPFSPKQPPNLEPKDENGLFSAQLFISALAGPMSRDKAFKLYKRWKTPTQRTDESNNNDIVKMPDTHIVVGEYTDSYRERHIKNSDIEKGLEVVGRQLASQEQLQWREYWDFLDAFVDIRTPEGLDRLEGHLVAKSEQAKKEDAMMNHAQLFQSLNVVASEQQQQQLDRSSANIAEVVPNTITEFQTPYTCVEKSLQVFAKRITKTLIINIKEVFINDMVLSELKRLKTLVASFMIDARFTHVDFSKVHSRIAHLVASYVFDSQEVNVAMRLLLLQMLRKLLKLLAPDERGREQHLGCWCSSLLQKLEQNPGSTTALHQLPDAVNTEELYINAWEAEHSCPCQWVVPHNLSRKSSRRKRTESLRAAVAAATTASASEDNDKTLFYDCLETATEDGTSSEEENFGTPPESMTPQWTYQLYIYGKEPTKRDVDVLNAIINVNLDEETRPRLHAWRANMESFPASELELFPSPKNVQKAIIKPPKPIGTILATPKLGSFGGITKGGRRASPNLSIQPPAVAVGAAAAAEVRIFSSSLSPVLSFESLAAAAQTFPTAQTFQSPLNKMRELLSKYREVRSTSELDSSSGSGR